MVSLSPTLPWGSGWRKQPASQAARRRPLHTGVQAPLPPKPRGGRGQFGRPGWNAHPLPGDGQEGPKGHGSRRHSRRGRENLGEAGRGGAGAGSA